MGDLWTDYALTAYGPSKGNAWNANEEHNENAAVWYVQAASETDTINHKNEICVYYRLPQLCVEKTVEGDMGDYNQPFNFSFVIAGKEEYSYNYQVYIINPDFDPDAEEGTSSAQRWVLIDGSRGTVSQSTSIQLNITRG